MENTYLVTISDIMEFLNNFSIFCYTISFKHLINNFKTFKVTKQLQQGNDVKINLLSFEVAQEVLLKCRLTEQVCHCSHRSMQQHHLADQA